MYFVVDRHKQDGARSAVAADSQSDPPGFCHGHMQTSSDARQDNSSLIEKVSVQFLVVAADGGIISNVICLVKRSCLSLSVCDLGYRLTK